MTFKYLIGGVSITAITALLFSSLAHAEILTLSEGLRIATEKSRLIRIARSDEDIAEDEALIVRARMLPEINASFSGTQLAYQPEAIFGPGSVPLSQKGFLAYSLNIQQTLFDFRRSASRFEASRMGIQTRKLDTRRIRDLVAIGFALSYFDLLETEKLVAVAEREVERLESHLRDAKSLHEEGVITKNDLLQAEVRLSDALQRLLGVRNTRMISAANINDFLRRPLTTEVRTADLDELILSYGEVEIGMEKAWEEAGKQRTELQIVDATMKALDLEQAAKRAEYYPKLFARGSVDYTENRFQVHETNLALTLGMSVNLFSGGSTKAEVSRLEHQKMKLIEQRNRLVDEIRLEVQRQILNTKTARERVRATRDAVRQAEENLRINTLRYEAGVGTATEVLDAVTLLTLAETNHYRSVYDLGKSEAAMLYATGKDLLEVYK
jgi:outer membrane protein TolC